MKQSETTTLPSPLTGQTWVINRVTRACGKFMKCQGRVPAAAAGSVLPSFEFLFLGCIFLRRSPASAAGASFVLLTPSLCKGKKNPSFQPIWKPETSPNILPSMRLSFWKPYFINKRIQNADSKYVFVPQTGQVVEQETLAFTILAIKSLQHNTSPYHCTRYK